MKVKITKKFETAQDICAFELADPNGGPLPAFSAGAHVDVQLGNGLVRQYSLCNNPGDTHRYMLGVLRDPASRGGSIAMHALQEGAELDISEPRNHFPLDADARHSILLAGGIGVTPILCMAERLAHAGASFEFHYCTRSPERTAFRDRVAEPDLQGHAHVYHDSAPPEQRADLAKILGKPDAATHVYVCGPGGFIDAVLGAAKNAGWQEANLHREYFTAAPVSSADDASFEVKVASSGQVVTVAPDQSVVEALAAAGVEVLTSCEQGVCGTCLTRVLEGTPDHRDLYLTEAEQAANDQFLPCCSRSKSPLLVLDL